MKEKIIPSLIFFVNHGTMDSIERDTHTNYCFASKEPGRASRPIECGTAAAAAGSDEGE